MRDRKRQGLFLGTVCLVSLCDWEVAGHLLFKVVQSNSPVASDFAAQDMFSWKVYCVSRERRWAPYHLHQDQGQ